MELRERVEQDLDMTYVRKVAYAVRTALRDGATIEASFQPGDGTNYDLVFVPTAEGRLRTAPAREWEPGTWTTPRIRRLVRYDDAGALVVWIEHGSICIDLMKPSFYGTYVAEAFSTTDASGWALAILFDEIAKA